MIQTQPESPVSPAHFCALVIGPVPIVRAGMASALLAEFGAGARVFRTDWPRAPLVFASAGESLDLVAAHLPGAAAADVLRGLMEKHAAEAALVRAVQRADAGSAVDRGGAVRSIGLGAPVAVWRDAFRRAWEACPRAGLAQRDPRRASVLARDRPRITARQREVLDMLALGLSNKAIAERLGLSVGTVKLHVAAILHALDARSRVDLVVRQAGLRLPALPATGEVADAAPREGESALP